MSVKSAEEVLELAVSASLARVIDLLKFAEAKNAALLAFASAWIVGLVNILSSGKVLPSGFHVAVVFALILFIASAILAIVSLLPKLEPSVFTGEARGENPNLLFFGDIATETVESFQIEVRKRYVPEEGKAVADRHIHDMAAQIAINSRVARRKYLFFNYGALLALAAVCSFSVPAIGMAVDALR